MLTDLRFALGAILAIALLAVAGVGVVTSVRLAREAHMGPLEDSRSLAYAAPAARNAFYDPDGARIPRVEATAEPPERTASTPANPPAADAADDKEIDAARTAKMLAMAPARPGPSGPVEAGAAPPEPPAADGAGAPPADRLASTSAADPSQPMQTPIEARPPAQAADPWAPPAPRPRPKPQFRKRFAHTHFRRAVAANSQPWPNSSWPNTPWPGFDGQFGAVTPAKRAANR
ncbi:MAG TPA: hypothetical protein VIY51_21915 [Xanthobacteraceae bacterium]